MGEVTEKISDTIFGRPEVPKLPEPEIPAAPAPSRREDTGANVVIGSDSAQNQRVSGRGSGTGRTSGRGSGDVLGNLGKGGLNI